jgi:O-antigen ligase
MVLFPALLFLFRQELGARRVVQYIVVGTLALVIASAIAITYTDFGQLYERMGNVAEVENGVPTGRAGAWTPTLEKLGESPWVGEGPLFLTPEHGEMLGQLRSNFDPYPHSLYLYLIRTVGVVGLIAVVWFFVQVWFIVYAGWKRESVDAYRSAILRFGVLLIPAFLVDQVRLEFNRPTWLDFAQFILAMMGLLVGVADRVGREPSETSASAPEQDFRSDMHLSGNLT